MHFSSFVFPAEKMWQTFVASFKVAKTSAQQSSQHFQPFRQIHSSRDGPCGYQIFSCLQVRTK